MVEAKFKAGGAVLLGKLATHEFAIGGPSFDLPFPPARNPWNLDHFTGGSSSGSGAAVAAGLVRMAMGSDTGGSIRGPAFYCGTVGLKPTYGLVSRRGVFPLSYTLDHCGPLAWTVEDAALTMQVIAGHDPLDPASADLPVPDFTGGLGEIWQASKLAYPRSFFATQEGMSPEVIASLDAAAQQLAKLGAKVEEVTLPDFELFNACGRIILTAEAYAIHEQDLLTRPLDYGRYTYQRMMVGATLSAADLTQAFRLRRELAAAVNGKVLDTYDAIITANGLTPGSALRRVPGRRAAEDDAADHAVQRAPAIRRWRSRPGSPRAGCRSACRSSAARSTSRPCCASAPPTRRRRAGSTSARRSNRRSRRDAQHRPRGVPASRLAHPQRGATDAASSPESQCRDLPLGLLRCRARAAADHRQRRPRHHRHAQRRAASSSPSPASMFRRSWPRCTPAPSASPAARTS